MFGKINSYENKQFINFFIFVHYITVTYINSTFSDASDQKTRDRYSPRSYIIMSTFQKWYRRYIINLFNVTIICCKLNFIPIYSTPVVHHLFFSKNNTKYFSSFFFHALYTALYFGMHLYMKNKLSKWIPKQFISQTFFLAFWTNIQ